MNFLYTVDNNFIPQLAAGVTSICENNSDEGELVFYVFSNGITEENQNKLYEYLSRYPYAKIVFIDIVGFMDEIGFSFDTSGWNDIVMARLLMNRFLPKEVDRVLYLDGDTIVRRSLRDLWRSDLGRNVIGASIEPTVDGNRLGSLGLENMPYYNAGVLLVNLEEWRKQNVENRLLDYCKDNAGVLFANDQDAINAVLKESIYTISPAYNFFNALDIYPFAMLKTMMPSFVDESVFEAAKTDPCIIHYLGEERPWRKGNTHKYRDDYKKYLFLTPWANMPDETGWELYFVAWKLFNSITKPVPSVRYRIINGLIPAFVAFRKATK